MGAPSQVTHNHSTAHRAQTAENREQAGAMRHLRNFRKLNRTSSHRKAMMRNQVTQLIKHDAIVTTLPKAKELRRLADQVVTLAKQNSLHSFRQARAVRVATRGLGGWDRTAMVTMPQWLALSISQRQ